MVQEADDLHRRMYQRILDSYSKALRAFEAGVRYDYGALPPLPGCPQFTSVAPPPKRSDGEAGQSASAASAGLSKGGLLSNQARTLELLQKRQAELRSAATRAKATGDIVKAKEYLRQSLGMNNMIRSVEAGLPVDLKQLPPAPRAQGASASSSAGEAAKPTLSGVACDPPVEFQTRLMNAGKGEFFEHCQVLLDT